MNTLPSPHQSGQSEQHEADSRRQSAETVYHLASEWIDNEEDDSDDSDMDYEPPSERSEDADIFSADSGGTGDELNEEQAVGAEDNEDDLSGIQIEFTLHDADLPSGEQDAQPEEEERTRGQRDTSYIRITSGTAGQLFQLLEANGLREILQSHVLLRRHFSDDDDLFGRYRSRRRRRSRPAEDVFPKVPSEAGTELMGSGHYGYNPHYLDQLKHRRKRFATKLMWRELGSGTREAQLRASRTIAQELIPGSIADKIIHYDSRCYSGQFSDDGNFFFCCSQDFKVRMYDTSNPFDWKYYKTVEYPLGQWTITDASLSPDNRYLAYSSIRNIVCLAATDPYTQSDPALLDFARGRQNNPRRGSYSIGSHFGIFSIRFSGDGREIVAGTNDRSVVVYDIETSQSILRLQNHENDVNAVCFGDTSSPHILYSGSDDTTLRVWDRRSMADGREAGAFIGHTEGLTYVDSKGDGRFVLSNGKDQMMKLWDLRKMMTTAQFDTINPSSYSTDFDYRFSPYEDEYYEPHPHDCSVVTFRGHKVLKTLIRCHFSPPGSTNSRYVYTGSQDGKVYVYNLDATVAGVIDVALSSRRTRPRDYEVFASAYEMGGRGDIEWTTCVRDASWHPSAPVLAATSWNGLGMSTGTCTVHSWNDNASDDEGDPPLGKNYNSELEPIQAYNRGAEDIRRRGMGTRFRSRNARAQDGDR